MRRAAVLAGLIPDTPDGHSRVSFVTEGEASLHFAIENGILSEVKVSDYHWPVNPRLLTDVHIWLPQGSGVVIVDAGGGTIDISSYKADVKQVKRTFEEIAAPQCTLTTSCVWFQASNIWLKGHLYGSVFVSIQANTFLESLSPCLFGQFLS